MMQPVKCFFKVCFRAKPPCKFTLSLLMHSKKTALSGKIGRTIPLLILFFWWVSYLIFTWWVQIKQWAKWENTPTPPTPQVSWYVLENLTGKLLISPFGSHDEILWLLQEAKYSIDIRWYQISDKQLITVLKNKAKSGVKIRIILENSMHGDESGDYFSFYKQIKWTGIEVTTDEWLWTNYVHAKTFIIDNHVFIVSTANSTYPWFFGNREYRFVSQQKTYAHVFTKVFEQDRKKQYYSAPLPENIWICPFNCRWLLTSFINQATKSIYIQAQYLEDKALIEQLQQKASQGLVIRLIFGKYQEDLLPDDLKNLTRLQWEPNVHAKNILIDNKQLYIWSMNLSTNAIEQNREIGVVTSDSNVLEIFSRQFDEDWNTKARPYTKE